MRSMAGKSIRIIVFLRVGVSPVWAGVCLVVKAFVNSEYVSVMVCDAGAAFSQVLSKLFSYRGVLMVTWQCDSGPWLRMFCCLSSCFQVCVLFL
jgi:hypothetical protein